MRPRKVISGGQTGVDRAALEAARDCGIETGGYAPARYMTDIGVDLTLREFNLMPRGTYAQRTRLNVRAADCTLCFMTGDSPGMRVTLDALAELQRPYLRVNPFDDFDFVVEAVQRFMRQRRPCWWIVNVAGHRERTHPGIYTRTAAILRAAWTIGGD